MLSKKSTARQWIIPAIIVCGTFVAAVFISYSTPFRQLENKITDQLFDIRGPLPFEDSTVVVVAISEQADNEIPYKFPWPTDFYAKLIENLNKAGAKAIGIDVIFDKRDNYDLRNDTLFAETLKKFGNVVLAGKVSRARQDRGGGSSSISSTIVGPNSVLSNANPNDMGLVTVVQDADKGVRRYQLFDEFNDKKYYAMGLELLRLYHGWEQLEIKNADSRFHYGEYVIPKYDYNTMGINFFGAQSTFPRHSFESVIDDSTVLLASEDPDFQLNTFSDPDFGLLNEGVFKDKIVLVGATMQELHDFHNTPFTGAASMPGVEIHANAIQTILSGKFIRYASAWLNLLMIAVITLVVVVVTKYASGFWGFIFFIAAGISYGGLVLFEFLNFRFVLDLTGPMLGLTLGYVATNSYQYFIEQKEKQRIRGMFSSYVSPALVNKMVESGQEPSLGGDQVYITAFFSDIQSFSSFSEQLEPGELVTLINEYLSAMTEILTDEGGTLDKYIGDAIVAFFGAPVELEDHAYRACLVSQLMQEKLGELREKWKQEEGRWPEIVRHMRNRIGINTGLMVTGNMGSERRFNYTMMGDNVNLAARCESGAKAFGVYTMVTGDTKREAEQFGDRCVFRYLDRIVVKGRTQPVDVFEIMGLKESLSDRDLQCRELFEKGTEAYKGRFWDTAAGYFKQSRELEPFQPGNDNPLIETNPSLIYLERCRQMKANPPPEDWNGVYVMQTK